MSHRKIILVEPKYYTQFPPVGLLKFSTYHKQKGDSVQYVKGFVELDYEPDLIYVTSLFTWTWRPVWDVIRQYKTKYPASKIILGGIYASVMPDHAKYSGADVIIQGICDKVENMPLDYSLVPKWDGSILFTSRGCGRKCGFCAVPRIEGKICKTRESIKDYVVDAHSRIILFDNNFLLNPHKDKIFAELREYDKYVDFNQGIDARLITEDIAIKISELKLDSTIRIAYDAKKDRDAVYNAIENLHQAGISKRSIFVYTLFNYTDTPADFFDRTRDILNWGAVCYPMRYEPLRAITKNSYVSPNWTIDEIEAIQAARRVIGYGGAFPAYTGLVDKITNAFGFADAFELRELKQK
ncbi:B12-binding domain-containing radical SAM protein [Methanorbis furvi]|uniref:B12-binding domain-containing protein n=1 Tax=Methanorbis furvi TaxID=3028299 RepID=A0AAE4ME65_9EURY|nr:hypothetical protein [Methanocorpusculaceae archaeon Ag1]